MSNPIVMPQLGLTMTEGMVSGWLKKPGDFVKKNEFVFTVSTDKVEMEVESMAEGILGEILVPAGETVPVGTVLAFLEGEEEEDIEIAVSEQPSAELLQELEPAKASASAAMKPADGVGLKFDKALTKQSVSPRARRLAEEFGVDLATLNGSGNNGEVVEADIRNAASSKTPKAPRTAPAAQPNLRRRQLIAERLTRSIQTIPTFSVAAEANAESLLDLYESLRHPPAANGVRLTVTDLLLTVFGSVLKDSADISATWEDNGPRNNSSIDVGLAVATPEGVVAPIIKSLDALDLPQLITKRHELAERARNGKLTFADMEGGVSTLSNLGMYRVDHFEALISPGQSSILAVGKIRRRPWVEETLVVRPTVILNFTVDHRIADGAAAAVFLGKLIDLIEKPSGYAWQPALAQSGGAGQRRNA